MGYERNAANCPISMRCSGAAAANVLGNHRRPAGPASVRYVITLDTDTQLPRDSARQLVGTMAHPLNRPVHDASGRTVEGYSILQPRVSVSLTSAGRSRFAKLFSGDPGIDPYTPRGVRCLSRPV